MNKKNRFYKKLTALIATGLLTAAVSGTALAADTVQLDLHDSVQMALENNRTIRQALTDVDTDALESAPHDGPDAFLEYDGLPHRRRYV